jgi:hypothetical protein
MNKTNIAIVAALSLGIAVPVSAAGINYNPVIPLHHTLKSSSNARLPRHMTVLPSRLHAIPSQLPDLKIQQASIALTGQCKPSAPVLKVTAVIQNIGHSASAAELNVGMVQAIDGANNNWRGATGLPALTPGQSTTVSIPIYYQTPDPAAMPGLHKFSLIMNAGKWVKETNYNNNGYTILQATIPCGPKSDITSTKGPRIGGKVVPWGGSVVLSKANARSVSANGICIFDMFYSISNKSNVATHPAFVDRMDEDGKAVALNSNLHLNATETKTLQTEPSLQSGTHILRVSLDDGHVVSESNETNNVFQVKVTVDKTCKGY